MNSGMIAKMEKAHRYAEERDRFHVEALRVRVDGDNSSHLVRLDGGAWGCDCDFFTHNATCAHTMAVGLMLGTTAPETTPEGAGTRA
jgi:hypothetical protein